jgi:hypothetical protein
MIRGSIMSQWPVQNLPVQQHPPHYPDPTWVEVKRQPDALDQLAAAVHSAPRVYVSMQASRRQRSVAGTSFTAGLFGTIGVFVGLFVIGLLLAAWAAVSRPPRVEIRTPVEPAPPAQIDLAKVAEPDYEPARELRTENPVYTSSGTFVRGYTRKDGTHVSGYYRHR